MSLSIPKQTLIAMLDHGGTMSAKHLAKYLGLGSKRDYIYTCINSLKRKGLVESAGYGRWSLTPEGDRAAAKALPDNSVETVDKESKSTITKEIREEIEHIDDYKFFDTTNILPKPKAKVIEQIDKPEPEETGGNIDIRRSTPEVPKNTDWESRFFDLLSKYQELSELYVKGRGRDSD